jgi:hypothetical protein
VQPLRNQLQLPAPHRLRLLPPYNRSRELLESRSAKPAARTPVRVDQVVDQVIEREHALMNYLKDRKPLVETYLQNLTPDTKLGAAPQRRSLFPRAPRSWRVGRSRDYLSEQPHFQDMLMGGFTRLFRIQYQPIGSPG